MPKFLPSFLQSLKDTAVQRIEDRIKRELGPQLPESEADEPPSPAMFGPDMQPVEQEPTPGLASRLKNTILEGIGKLGPVQRKMLDPSAPLDEPTIKYRLKYAGENRMLVYMKYNGQFRHVEAYSFRKRGVGANGQKTWLFYGFCRVHMKIHAFRLDKIQGLIVTNEPFTPQWPIELS